MTLLQTIKPKIDEHSIISFDIFDTLLVRPYVRPTHLFVHVEKAYRCRGFAAERIDAERRARIRHKEMEDVTLDMIYEEINGEFRRMKQRELDWEEMVLRVNPELKQVYDYALTRGKKIVITSDMYLPTDFLSKILKKNSLNDWYKLYVSCDVGKCKGSGALWEHLIRDNSCTPEMVLHIGDNQRGDFNVPRQLGIDAILYPSFINQFGRSDIRNRVFIRQCQNKLGASILISIFAYKWQLKRCGIGERENYWSKLGYYYAGPIAYGYTRFLEVEATKRSLNHLLFVARDGYTLQRVFNIYNHNLKNSYVYANGALRRITSLECKNNSVYGKYIVDYYSSLCSEIRERKTAFTFRTSSDYERFINENRELFEPLQNEFRNDYAKYLSFLISKEDRILVVDTMARTFASLELIKDFTKNPVLGAYFTYVKEPFSKYFKFCSFARTVYAYRDNVKWEKSNVNLFTKNWDFIEFLLSSPEQPIKQIDKRGLPVYEETQNIWKLRRAEVYPYISNAAVDFAQDVQKWFKGHDIFIEFDSLIEWVNVFMDAPTKEGIEALSGMRFFHGVGDTFCAPLFAMKIPLSQVICHPWESLKIVRSLKWKTPLQKFVCYGIYHKIKRPNESTTKLFGMVVSSVVRETNKVKKKELFGAWKVIKELDTKRKNYFLFGVKILRRKRRDCICELPERIIRRIIDRTSLNVQRSLTIAFLHQKTFSEFRNCNQGGTIVLIGAGPTVNQFQPIEGAKYIGLNRAFLYDKVHFDYLFTIDKRGLDIGVENYWSAFLNYDCLKFVGDQNLGPNFQIPQSTIYLDSRIRRYKTSANHLPGGFVVDIDTEALANSTSCSLQAMQFALFTNPAKVYVVGVDCTVSSMTHFIGGAYDTSVRNESAARNDASQILAWRRLKSFVATYYPDTKIVIVNPVGLKGIFQDVYTKPFLRKHPEIDTNNIKMLDKIEKLG